MKAGSLLEEVVVLISTEALCFSPTLPASALGPRSCPMTVELWGRVPATVTHARASEGQPGEPHGGGWASA